MGGEFINQFLNIAVGLYVTPAFADAYLFKVSIKGGGGGNNTCF